MSPKTCIIGLLIQKFLKVKEKKNMFENFKKFGSAYHMSTIMILKKSILISIEFSYILYLLSCFKVNYFNLLLNFSGNSICGYYQMCKSNIHLATYIWKKIISQFKFLIS